uniref:Uncharacterized protein n=1 Tax=Nothobranchius furzeri TaxID=105023 RepID=A0A8C6L9F5_NOTFU
FNCYWSNSLIFTRTPPRLLSDLLLGCGAAMWPQRVALCCPLSLSDDAVPK